jgi:hypothetical protein
MVPNPSWPHGNPIQLSALPSLDRTGTQRPTTSGVWFAVHGFETSTSKQNRRGGFAPPRRFVLDRCPRSVSLVFAVVFVVVSAAVVSAPALTLPLPLPLSLTLRPS